MEGTTNGEKFWERNSGNENILKQIPVLQTFQYFIAIFFPGTKILSILASLPLNPPSYCRSLLASIRASFLLFRNTVLTPLHYHNCHGDFTISYHCCCHCQYCHYCCHCCSFDIVMLTTNYQKCQQHSHAHPHIYNTNLLLQLQIPIFISKTKLKDGSHTHTLICTLGG